MYYSNLGSPYKVIQTQPVQDPRPYGGRADLWEIADPVGSFGSPGPGPLVGWGLAVGGAIAGAALVLLFRRRRL